MKVNEKGVSKLSPPGRLDERRERKRKARDVSDVVPDKKQKKRIFTWRGVIANSDHWMRWMVAVILIVVGATLTYTQLGFADLVLPDGRVGYVVVLLEVVALGALLLGTLAGMTLGVIIGGVLYIHSQVLPLDHYELTFVTPLTSIVMFGVCGALLGILFAFVLRNNPSQIKRVIYICIVCLVVSELYSLGLLSTCSSRFSLTLPPKRAPTSPRSSYSKKQRRLRCSLAIWACRRTQRAWSWP